MLVGVEESHLNEMIQRLKDYQKMQDILIEGLTKIADTVEPLPLGNPYLDKIKIIFTNTARQFFKTNDHATPSNH